MAIIKEKLKLTSIYLFKFQISPAYKATAKGAMYATLATVKVSGFVAKRVGSLSKGVSNYLAKKVCWK